MVVLTVAACGAPAAEPQAPEQRAVAVDDENVAPGDVPVEPVAVAVAAVRKGGSILLEITGIGRGHREGGLFEDPATWSVEASADGSDLERLVNGPVRVSRNPVGRADGDQWDVTVRFSVSFACPEDAGDVHVRVHPPDSPAIETVIARDSGSAGQLGTVTVE